MSKIIQESAPVVLDEVKKAKHILLHCHPSPDPDSLGSALGMKFALEQLGKKVTLIKGDSNIPRAFSHFPGYDTVVQKNFFEVDLTDFDLFIAQDSGSTTMISRLAPVVFPAHLKVIVIDHHASNTGYGSINVIDASYPATAHMLYDLFVEWGIKLDRNIAANLFMGIYTDTGGFKFSLTIPECFDAAYHLSQVARDFPEMISLMENSKTKASVMFEGAVLSGIESYCDDQFILSVISQELIEKYGVAKEEMYGGSIASVMRMIATCCVAVVITEEEKGECRVNLRSRGGDKYDVSKVATILGGGGHKAASGAKMKGTLEEVKRKVIEEVTKIL